MHLLFFRFGHKCELVCQNGEGDAVATWTSDGPTWNDVNLLIFAHCMYPFRLYAIICLLCCVVFTFCFKCTHSVGSLILLMAPDAITMHLT